MPIHDQSYRRYGGSKAAPGRAWSVIARAGVMTMIRKRAFLGLLLFAWLPFVVRAVQIYVASNYPQTATLLAPDAKMFRDFLEQQDFFVFVMTIYVGAGLIAQDRRANALQIYLSKPLMRAEYIAGKAAVLFTFLMLITWVPAILLLFLQVMFKGSFEFLRANLFLFPAITVGALLEALVATLTMLALSSLSKSSRYVGILYSGILFFTAAIYGAMLAITGDTSLSWLSVGSNLQQIVDIIFRQTPPLCHALAGVVDRPARSPRGVDLRARAARPRRGDRDMSAPIVTADHVSKWYGQVIGLNDVSVNVPAGITGLLGPNGAGKSTFMKLITGQLKPSKGGLTVLGEPIWRNPHLYFQIGFCPEQDAFYERMTGLEWVTALVRLNGLGEKDGTEAAVRALTAVDLMDAANKKIGAYSKGMRQRVKLAQAIVHDPQLLILDEPLSGMDPLARRKTIRLIREWARAGKSIIVSSHILHEIESMTATILLINNGRILAEGDVHQIRDLIDEHPHTVYVRADQPRVLAREFLDRADVRSMRFEDGAVVVETGTPDAFYARLTELAASGEYGAIDEVTSPDDNLQAVFQYLVK